MVFTLRLSTAAMSDTDSPRARRRKTCSSRSDWLLVRRAAAPAAELVGETVRRCAPTRSAGPASRCGWPATVPRANNPQVAVGAVADHRQRVAFFRETRQHQHAHALVTLAHRAQHVDAALPGQRQIEQQHVDRLFARRDSSAASPEAASNTISRPGSSASDSRKPAHDLVVVDDGDAQRKEVRNAV